MKKHINIIITVLLVSVVILSSCQKDFTEVNTDPINITSTSPEKLLAPALVSSLSAGMSRNRSFNNELMQVTVSISDGDATVFRYEYRSTWSDYLWNAWFVQLTNFKDIYKLAGQPEHLNKSYQGISLVCQSWLISMLTDSYGDIPYTEAGQGATGLVEPKFDKQKDIYLDLFKKLEEANILLSSGTAIKPSSDPVFKGDISKWRKFCNSLYLRLLLRVSGKSDVAAISIAKIKEIVEGNVSNYPVMANNAESATIKWTGGTSTSDAYTSPYVNGVRAQDFKSPSLGSFFVDHLVTWSDPRLDVTTPYGDNGANSWGVAQGGLGGYTGVPSGYAIGTGVIRGSYFYSNDQSITGGTYGPKSLQQSPLTGILMNYAELQFILAEASARGFISGSAERYYDAGIASSINYWVPAFPSDPSSTVVKNYITGADIDWNDALPLNIKMEKIHLQKYYALFMVDLQQWFEFRRTGHPELPKGPGLRNGGVMPARMSYPVYVQSANPSNYQAAVANQGLDVISTNVWWQKP